MKNLLLILSVFFTSFTYCQNNSTIAWEKSKKLTWNDFQGTTDASNYGSAKTSYQIKIIPEEVMLDEEDRILDYENMTVQAEFNKNLSYSMAKFSSVLLQHEQLHFDIAELFAREIRKKIYQNKISNKITYDAFWADYKKLWNECTKLQKKFDTETDHGRNLEQNSVWENFVETELKKLVEFE